MKYGDQGQSVLSDISSTFKVWNLEKKAAVEDLMGAFMSWWNTLDGSWGVASIVWQNWSEVTRRNF